MHLESDGDVGGSFNRIGLRFIAELTNNVVCPCRLARVPEKVFHHIELFLIRG